MRILLPGGSGQVGTILAWHLHASGHQVTVLSRTPQTHASHPWRTLPWDGLTPGPWTAEIDRSDAVIHLSGRSVNCRYNFANREAIFDSRIKPTLLLGKVIAASSTPPRIWMNASTSTFYRHALDRPQDEFTGELGDLPSECGTREPANLPETWSFSIDVASSWERAFLSIPTPRTRKIRLRSSMVDLAYCLATELLPAQPEITEETNGVVNMTAPEPLPNRDFMRVLREAWHMPVG